METVEAKKPTNWTTDPLLGKRLLTVEEAARYLGMGTTRFREILIYSHALKVVRTHAGGKICVDREDLDKWIEEHKEYA